MSWTIDRLLALGFKLVQNDKLWCRFEGYNYEFWINLDTKYVVGNYFNFSPKGNNYGGGSFKAIIETEEEFQVIINCILNKRKII